MPARPSPCGSTATSSAPASCGSFPIPRGDRVPGYRDPARDGQECVPVYLHEASAVGFCRLRPAAAAPPAPGSGAPR
jgi:hypothetical protein